MMRSLVAIANFVEQRTIDATIAGLDPRVTVTLLTLQPHFCWWERLGSEFLVSVDGLTGD